MSCLSRRSPHGGGDGGSGQAHSVPLDLPSELLAWAFPPCSNEPELKWFKHSKAWITNPCNSAGMLVAIWMLLAWTTGQWQNWRPVLRFALLSTPVTPSLLSPFLFPSLCTSQSIFEPTQLSRYREVNKLHHYTKLLSLPFPSQKHRRE